MTDELKAKLATARERLEEVAGTLEEVAGTVRDKARDTLASALEHLTELRADIGDILSDDEEE